MYRRRSFARELPLHLMLLPALAIVLIFNYGPMFGSIIAFQRFDVVQGFFKSPWVGLDNFRFIFNLPDFYQLLRNTILIASLKIVSLTLFAILLALLISEINKRWFTRTVQTIIYFPHFISWVILGGILRDILAREGVVNKFLGLFGIQPVMFLGDNKLFPFVLAATEVWKSAGFAAIVYLVAIINIDPTLYEAAIMDGANRLQQVIHITIPGMMPVIILMAALNLGNILNAGFEQVFTLYSPMVYQSGDIIDTWVYRMGLLSAQFSIASAVGLFKSVAGFVLISLSYILAYKFADYRIF